jgi:uncharacterized glyoxalase superfamily protein PhnB
LTNQSSVSARRLEREPDSAFFLATTLERIAILNKLTRQQMSDANPTSSTTQSARKIIPHFPSSSIPSTVRYYTEVLHFKSGGPQYTRKDHPEPTFCSVSMGAHAAANIYFFHLPNDAPTLHPGKAMIAMSTDGLEEYYSLLKREGKVHFVEDIEDKEWGYRQFEVSDEDGNRLQFFRFLED